MILAGDIGGTHARFALFEDDAKKRPLRHEALESRHFKSVEEALRAFLGKKPPRIKAATIGIAGPVIDQRCVATNLPWVVDARTIARKLGLKNVTLINDLVALGFGALTVPPKRLRVLSGGSAPKKKGGNLAILAAGTGLGEAGLIWDGARHVPLACEGGHTDFGAQSPIEWELCMFLQKRYGHVSYERIAAGPGFSALYDFFCDAQGMRESPENAELLEDSTDRNATIARLGAEEKSEIATRAVDLFARIYGAEAGNLALKTLATAGVYVAGSIAGHLVDVLARGPFVEAFLAKGRFRPLLEKVPLAIVLDPDIGLAGSSYHAARSIG